MSGMERRIRSRSRGWTSRVQAGSGLRRAGRRWHSSEKARSRRHQARPRARDRMPENFREEDATEDNAEVVDQQHDCCRANCLRTSITEPKTPPAKKRSCPGGRMRVIAVHRAACSGGEAPEPPADVEGFEDLSEEDRAAEDQRHRGKDGGHGASAVFVAARVAISAKDRHKHHRGSAAREKIRDECRGAGRRS